MVKGWKQIYAGGLATSQKYNGPTVIRRWDLTKIPVSHTDISSNIRAPIRDIAPIANNGVVFTTDLDIGIVNKDETRLLSPFLAHTNQSSVRMDNSGNIIEFYYQKEPGESLGDKYIFNATSRYLSPVQQESGLNPPPFDVPGMRLITPYDGDTPTS